MSSRKIRVYAPFKTKCDLLHLIRSSFLSFISYSVLEKMVISKVFYHFIFFSLIFFFLSLLEMMVHEISNSVWLVKENGMEFINVKLIL